MNAEEQHLITDLFDRLRAYGAVDKDLEAERLIISLARQNPDAGYMLVQNVLVQEQTIAGLQEEVEQLRAQLAQLQRGTSGRSGGFLGGAAGGTGSMFGGNRGSVPPTYTPQASQPAPSYVPPSAVPANPWSRPASAPSVPQRPAASVPPAQAAPPAASGGGFMRSAMGMAAGVAGGMLAANAIKNMMGGGGQDPSQPASSDFGSNDPGTYDSSGDNYGYGNGEDVGYGADDNDPGSFDSGSDEF